MTSGLLNGGGNNMPLCIAGQPHVAERLTAPAGQQPRTIRRGPHITGALRRRSCQRAGPVCGALPTQQQQKREPQQQWRALTDVHWAGSEQDALRPGSPMESQLPLWRLLLLSDGEELLNPDGS